MGIRESGCHGAESLKGRFAAVSRDLALHATIEAKEVRCET
jgi:hypothetical protein